MTPNGTITTTISKTETLEYRQSITHRNGYKNVSKVVDSKLKYNSILGQFETEIKWFNVLGIASLHLVMLWGLIAFPYLQKLKLIAYGIFIGGINGFGITGGAHRFWTHRSYKANLPLRIILMLCYTSAGQNSLFDWVRDHRVHHKYSETHADPHNSKRGFFFAHVGWLMMKKHPEVIQRGKDIDMSDVLADPVIQFHEKYFVPLKLLLCFIIPTIIPILLWDEDRFWSFLVICVGRYSLSLNFTWLVNSAAHLWGYRPYDKRINPAQNLGVSIVSMGEGWHNYHHTFPWDYKTAELGNYRTNMTTFWIDLFAKIGWAYDLKMPTSELVKKTVEKYGDGSHETWGHQEVPDPEIENGREN